MSQPFITQATLVGTMFGTLIEVLSINGRGDVRGAIRDLRLAVRARSEAVFRATLDHIATDAYGPFPANAVESLWMLLSKDPISNDCWAAMERKTSN